MKKYALIITCLAMLNGALFAQSSGGSSGGSSGSSGSSSTGGSTSGGSSSGGSSSGVSGSGSASGGTSSGGTVSEPSGAGTSGSSGAAGTSGTGSSGTSVGGSTSGTSGSAVIDASGASAISQTPGVITIQGTVNSSTEKQEIERQLRQVSGVNEVRNMLHISGQDSSPSSPGSSSGQPQSGTAPSPGSQSNP